MLKQKMLWSLGIAAMAAGVWHATAVASAGPDLLVQLTSGPITAHSGQPVTHTVEIAATGQATGDAKSQMTFSTTVQLEGATVTATSGVCQVVSPVSVTCEVNGPVDTDNPVVVTITGQIAAATAAGQVVYNVASLVTQGSDPDMSNNTSSNAYVLAATGGGELQPSALALPNTQVTHTAAAASDGSWGMTVLIGVVAAGLIQGLIVFMSRRKPSAHSARHAASTRYRPRHAKSWWRTFMDTELRRWGRGPGRRRRLVPPRAYRGTASVPAAGLVLVAFLMVTALPALATSPTPTPSMALEQVGQARDKAGDKKTPKPTKEPKAEEKPPPASQPTAVHASPDSSQSDASPAASANPDTPGSAAPALADRPGGAAPAQSPPSDQSGSASATGSGSSASGNQSGSAPAGQAGAHPDSPLFEPDKVDVPATEFAKTLNALHRTLRRAEYLRQMVTCTEADLAMARARVARIEEETRTGRASAKALEDAQGTAAVLQMALEATQKELNRVEARASALNDKATEWAKEAVREPSGRLAKVVDGRVSSLFGNRFDPYYKRWQLHSGVDIAAGQGTPIRAAAAGVVKHAGWNGGYGNHTCLEHGEVKGERMATCYAHQSEITVVPGQRVNAGDVIGKVGSTGASVGPHLHFEVRLGGRPVDPAPWLAS